MRTRANGTALLVAIIVGCAVSAASLGAQSTDSTRRWSLFGGSAPLEENGLTDLSHNVELGGSVDFRLRSFPVPLRAGLSFSQAQDRWSGTRLKFGTLSLDAVGHPLPKILGSRVYFLGGLGLATRSAYNSIGMQMNVVSGRWEYFGYQRPRENWGFVEGGAGLEFGRAFIQWKLQMPVASEGYVRAPISVGFHF